MSACRLGKFGARKMLYKPYWGLCFTAEEANVVISMATTGSPTNAVTVECSTDGRTWTTFYTNNEATPITLTNVGDKVYFRSGASGNEALASSMRAYRSFTSTGRFAASGNIMSLLDGNDPSQTDVESSFTFVYLFSGCSITSAPELPATTVSGSRSYGSMFNNCALLTDAPHLPATSTSNNGYQGMFSGCTSLSKISVAFTTWPSALASWVASVAATGTFYCPAALGTNETITRGISNCPEGWTVMNI